MPTLNFSQGENTSADEKRLREGELVKSIGAEYRIGNRDDIFKIPGRGNFADTGSGRKVEGVALLKFDTKSGDRLTALSNGTFYGAVPGAGAAFSSLKTGLSTSATRMGHAHYDDRQYIVNGQDRPFVLSSDQSVRDAGMIAPPAAIGTVTVSDFGGTTDWPSATPEANDGFTNFANSMDTDADTFAHAQRTTAGTATATWGSWDALALDDDRVHVKWAVAGQSIFDPDFQGDTGSDHQGIDIDSGYNVTVKIELSEDSGASFTTVFTETRTYYTPYPRTNIFDLAAGTNQNTVHVRVSMVYNSGKSAATLQVYDVRIQDGSSATAVTFATGVRYTYTEYDQNSGLESPPAPLSASVTGTGNQASMDVPGGGVAVNSNATHFNYYRPADGGSIPEQLGRVGTTELGSGKKFIDDFELNPITDQPGPLLEMVGVESQGSTLYFVVNQPPPALQDIAHYDGSLVGIRGRALYQSLAGRPESWPEINLIAKFPFAKHDTLVGLATVGDTLILGAKEVMIALDGLPRISSGIFSSSKTRTLEGAPGLVSQYAITKYADDDDSGGEPRVAWVSPFGVHETNGYRHRRLTSDIDWGKQVTQTELSEAVLHWNEETQQLIFQYSPTRYALIHMADEHRKAGGRPKITWGHYGMMSSIASGMVDNVHRVYSGHTQNGEVYRERSGKSDSSQTYDTSGTVPFSIKTGRVYNDYKYSLVTRAGLSHSDAGNKETATVTWTTGMDNPEHSRSFDTEVSISGNRSTQLAVIQSGEWHQVEINHTGFADFSLQDLRLETESLAQAGSVG
jgi:hypothetical protein